MRVLHVVAGAPTGGAETFSQDAILALAERGVEQRVICRPHPIPLARFGAAGIPVTPMRFSWLDSLLGAEMRIAGVALDFKPDLIHAWMARAASFVTAGLPCPVVGWFGGYYDLKYYRTSDAFVAVTQHICDTLIERGAPADRTFCNTTFGTLPDAPPVNRADLNTPEGAPVALVLSRMHWKKGIDTILEATARIPGLYLWLAGEGPEKEKYQALCTRLGLDDRVRFLGWRNDRKALIEAADIIALPSRYEPFGTVIIEAWSMGKPLVASCADGARQYVKDGENGLIHDIDDVDGLTAALGRLLTDPGLGARLISQATADFQRDWTKNVVIDRLLDTYGKVVALGKRGAKGQRG